MSRADYDDPLYRECIPQRPAAKPDSGEGPSVELMRRDRARLLWEMASDNATDDPAPGSSVVSA